MFEKPERSAVIRATSVYHGNAMTRSPRSDGYPGKYLSFFFMKTCCGYSSDAPPRKHGFSNILKILQPKKKNFRIKYSDILHIPARNIDCGYSKAPPRLTSIHNLCF